MPFTLKVMGISGDRVTFGVEADYRGSKIGFERKTYSMTPGEELHMTLNVHIQGFGDLADQVTELEASPGWVTTPESDLPLLYKVEPERG
jgi:hypothetical protein